MNFKTIRDILIGELSNYLKLNLISCDSNKENISYPYVTYKFENKYSSKGNYNLITKTVPSLDERFEHDIQYIMQEQPQAIISFTIYSNDSIESIDIVEKIRSWFEFEGKSFLVEHNIVTVKATEPKDSDIQNMDNHPGQKRLDITIRYSKEKKLTINTIEKINLSISKEKI